jgi:hypothetical protein
VRVVHFVNSDIASWEAVFVVLQNPESQDREIARAVHFANSDIASWEAVFVVLQNPESRDHEIARAVHFANLDMRAGRQCSWCFKIPSREIVR